MIDKRISSDSTEELEAQGLVPTMWDTMADAQIKSREGEFDVPEAPAEAVPEATERYKKTTKKESDDG